MSNYYEVEKILRKKQFYGEEKYLVKWVGWPKSYSTWEPLKNLSNVKKMVEEFEMKLKKACLSDTESSDEQEEKKTKLSFLRNKVKSTNLLEKISDLEKSEKAKTETNNIEELVPGNLDCDVPKRIIYAKTTSINNTILCQIEWNKRYDGSQPAPSFMSNITLRIMYPELLITFYESKIKIIK